MFVGNLGNQLIGAGLITISEFKKDPSQLCDIDAIKSFVWQSVDLEMKEKNDHEPTVLMIIDSKYLMVRLGNLFRDNEGKRLGSIVIKDIAANVRPSFLVFVTSAHVATIEAKSREEALRIEKKIRSYSDIVNYPNSIEAVVVSVETSKDRNATTEIGRVERNSDGNFVSIERMSKLDNGRNVDRDGLFSNMLGGR